MATAPGKISETEDEKGVREIKVDNGDTTFSFAFGARDFPTVWRGLIVKGLNLASDGRRYVWVDTKPMVGLFYMSKIVCVPPMTSNRELNDIYHDLINEVLAKIRERGRNDIIAQRVMREMGE
ncbi:MAG: hypothetical protein QM805_07815 [Pseudomonas sp.]